MCQDKLFIETVGYIKKEENLSTIENNILSNTFVLESLQPYPGYHGKNLPEKPIPGSLFLVLSKDYSFEEIARISKKIKNEFKFDFNASQGNIYFKTSRYSCIRIKYLKSFTFLPELQIMFQNEGIKFARQKPLDATGLIVIKKHFFVEEIEDGIYQDVDEPSKFYIDIPAELSWDEFKEQIKYIKNNIDNSDFDAAQGVFYRRQGIIDVVRLYICEDELERVKRIHQMMAGRLSKKL